MSHTAKFFPTRIPKEGAIVICERCGDAMVHSVLCGITSTDSSPEGDVHVWDDYLIVQCRGCKTVSFCRKSGTSEDEEISVSVYPPRIKGRGTMEDSGHLPSQIKKIYEETRAVIIQGLSILAGIGVRAIIETVCKEKGAAGSNLKEKIDSLASLGFITRKQADILHSLRFMGNAAAHETKAHSAQEVNIAFDIVEHLLNTVYLIEVKHHRLRPTAPQPSVDLD